MDLEFGVRVHRSKYQPSDDKFPSDHKLSLKGRGTYVTAYEELSLVPGLS